MAVEERMLIVAMCCARDGYQMTSISGNSSRVPYGISDSETRSLEQELRVA